MSQYDAVGTDKECVQTKLTRLIDMFFDGRIVPQTDARWSTLCLCDNNVVAGSLRDDDDNYGADYDNDHDDVDDDGDRHRHRQDLLGH